MKKKINNIIVNGLKESITLKSEILNSDLINQIENTGMSLIKCLKNGGKVLFAGNGGSFSDSQHLAAEFIGKFLIDRDALPALALGTNSSSISATSNDYGYENIFSRELSILGSNKDIFMPITTSGNSKNLIKAINTANDKKIKSVALTGASGGALAKLCECIKVPSNSVPRIQECHILIGHLLCQIVEEGIFKPKD